MNIPLDIYYELTEEQQFKYLNRLQKLKTSELHVLTSNVKQEILTQEFLMKVNKESGVRLNGLTTDCWIWEGAFMSNEYGQLRKDRYDEHYSHRWAYIRWNGPIDEHKLIRHKCDNRSCVNPEHLEIGNPIDNVRDMIERNTKACGRKLQPSDLPIIVERIKTELLKDISKDYDMNWKSISRALDKAGIRPEYNQKKLTPDQVEAIKNDTCTYAVLSAEYKISPSVISKIKHGLY